MAGRVTVTMEMTPTPAVLAQGFFITSERLQQLEEPLERCSPILSNEIRQNFDMQGRPTPWPPLADSTMQRRVQGSLTSDQRSALADLKADAKFEGELVVPPGGGDAVFVPSTTSQYAQVFAGLSSGIKILIDTGTLQTGATSGENYVVRRHDARSVSMEVADPTGYGEPHITGTDNIPQRDWAYISEQAVDEMAEVFAEWVEEAIQS